MSFIDLFLGSALAAFGFHGAYRAIKGEVFDPAPEIPEPMRPVASVVFCAVALLIAYVGLRFVMLVIGGHS